MLLLRMGFASFSSASKLPIVATTKYLNRLVNVGEIVNEDGYWVPKERASDVQTPNDS